MPSIRAEWIEAKVSELILNLCNQINVEEFVARINAELKDSKTEISDKLKSLEARHKKLMAEGSKLIDVHMEFGSTDVMKEKILQNKKDLESINAQIEEAQKERATRITIDPAVFARGMENIKDIIANGTIEQRRSAIQDTVAKIEIEKDKVKVYLKPTSGSSEGGYKAMVAEAGFEPTTFGL